MSVAVDFRQSLHRTERAAVIKVKRDWLVWNFKANEGRWCDTKKQALELYEIMK